MTARLAAVLAALTFLASTAASALTLAPQGSRKTHETIPPQAQYEVRIPEEYYGEAPGAQAHVHTPQPHSSASRHAIVILGVGLVGLVGYSVSKKRR